MSDSHRYANLHILSWILTHFFKKKVSVAAFNRDHYDPIAADGIINITVEALLPTDRELLYEVLCIDKTVFFE